MPNEEKKRILIVEDVKTFVEGIILPILDSMGLNYQPRMVDNVEEALKAIKNSYFDLVILDLGLYESKEKKPLGSKSLVGMKVWSEIKSQNDRNVNSIKVIVLSGNIDDEGSQLLLEGQEWTACILKKDVKHELAGAVDRALSLKERPKSIKYNGFSKDLLESLRQNNGKLHDYLNNRVINSFDKGDSYETINRAGEFLDKLLYEGFRGLKESPSAKWEEDKDLWKFSISEKKIEKPHLIYAESLNLIRNTFIHDKNNPIDPSPDDAAVALQLLVPLVRAYVNYKNRKA